jgi:hypothetical protein
MLKEPIEAGGVYRNRLGEKRGPMAISARSGMWVCQKTKQSYYNDGSSSEFNPKFDLVSRVKTTNECGWKLYRVRVRIEPEE